MRLLSAVFLSVLSMSAVAAAPEMHIGIVNVREILQKAPQADEINKTLEKEFLPRKNSIIAAQKSLKEKNEKYQRDAEVMSEAERKKSEKELLEKQRDLQRMEGEYKEDAQVRQREETEKLLGKISEILNKLAKEESYDLILHKEAVPYSASNMDITSKVIAKMQDKK